MDNEKRIPEHVWRLSFEYIPRAERENIPLVNNYFYKIMCGMEKFKKKLILTPEMVSLVKIKSEAIQRTFNTIII
jgi:hypothetical protein